MATAQYPFPPQFTNLVPAPEMYIKGLGMGTQLRAERERIQAQRDIAAMQAQLRSQEVAAENARSQQRLEIEKAYKDTYLGLQQQEMQRKEAAQALQMEEMSRKFALQQEWARGPQNGEPWEKFALRVGVPLSGSMAGTADLYERAYGQPFTPRQLTIPGEKEGTGTTYQETSKGHWIPMPPEAEEAKQVTIEGVKYLRTKGAGGQWDYQQVKDQAAGQQLINGGIPSQYVWKPGTTNEPMPGMAAVPTAEGWTTRVIPTGAATLISQQIQRMEDAYDAEILNGSREPRAAQAKMIGNQLPALRKRYRELNDALNDALSQFTSSGPVAPQAATAAPTAAGKKYDVQNADTWPREPDGRVRVTSPDGQQGSIPPSQVADAVVNKKFKLGWE